MNTVNVGEKENAFIITFAAMQSPTRLPLSKLPKGQKAIIEQHEESDLQLMLMEMGCIPGEPVWVEMIAPLGDPMAIQIAGYYLSLRKKDAEKIWVSIA